MRSFVLGGIVVAVAVGAGAAWGQDRGRAAGTPDQERARTIEARLGGDPQLADDRIVVEVTGKRVRLTGAVDSAAERQRAEEVLRAVDPTLVLDNQLTIEEQARARPAEDGEEEVSDEAITARLEAQLAADRAIDATGIRIETEKRVVTLTGQVRSEAERRRVIALARALDGVYVVVDAMEPAPAASNPAR